MPQAWRRLEVQVDKSYFAAAPKNSVRYLIKVNRWGGRKWCAHFPKIAKVKVTNDLNWPVFFILAGQNPKKWEDIHNLEPNLI